MIVSVLFFMSAIYALVEASTISSGLLKRQQPTADDIFNGSPGFMCYADSYNALGNNWNRTYSLLEPQQLHISLTDDATHARVQFATLGEIQNSVLNYWPKKDNYVHRSLRASKNKISIKGEVNSISSYIEREKEEVFFVYMLFVCLLDGIELDIYRWWICSTPIVSS